MTRKGCLVMTGVRQNLRTVVCWLLVLQTATRGQRDRLGLGLAPTPPDGLVFAVVFTSSWRSLWRPRRLWGPGGHFVSGTDLFVFRQRRSLDEEER